MSREKASGFFCNYGQIGIYEKLLVQLSFLHMALMRILLHFTSLGMISNVYDFLTILQEPENYYEEYYDINWLFIIFLSTST